MNSVTLVFFHLLLASAFKLNNAVGCPGCVSPVENPNSDEIRKLMSSTLSKTNSGYTITNVKNCKTQVVAGIKYDCEVDIKSASGVPATCRLVVVDKPWDKNEKVHIVEETCSSVSRTKREVCAGCPVEQDANSSEMKKKLTRILSHTNSGLSLVRGTKCTSQVVAGIMYRCTIEVESPKTNGVQTCSLDFLEQPWINPDPQITKDTCSQLVRNKREICAGCPVEQNPNDPEIKKKITNTLSQTNSELGLVNIEKCTSQVVAGALYKCTIRVNSPRFNGVETCVLELLEQPWISKDLQVVKDTCSQLGRAKRELLGGLKDVDSNEKVLVQELATYAVNTLDDIDADNNKRLVTEVIRAQKQLVNGIMYYLKLRVRTTSCDENKEINDECMSEDTSPQKMCDIQVYRSFADKSPLNAKVVKSECEPVTDMMKVGGFEPVQTNGDEVQKAAKFAAKRISEMVNSNNVKRIISIERASTQIVSGLNYAFTLVLGDTDCKKNKVNEDSVCKFIPHAKSHLVCEVVVYEKPWENTMKLTSSKCQDIPNVSVDRVKRGLLGGYTPVETNDDNVQEAANFAEMRINEKVNSLYIKKIVAVEQAKQQIVAGTNYDLTLRLRDTDCKKNMVDKKNCQFLSSAKMDLVCNVIVYQDLSNVFHLSKINCEDVPTSPNSLARNKRGLLGGYTPVETNDDNVQEAANFAETRINQQVNSLYIKKIVAIEQAKQQVVAGTNYDITLRLKDTDCKKNVADNKNCQFLSSAKTDLVCNVIVYKDLSNVYHLTKINCNDVPISPNSFARNKRALLGGYTPVETNDDNVEEAANFAEMKINQQVNSLYIKKIVAIEQAKQQVVAGTNYDLTLRLKDTDCKKNMADTKNCRFLPSAKMDLVCNVIVYKDLSNVFSLSKINCNDVPISPNSLARNKRSLIGGYKPITTNDGNVQKAADFAQTKINDRVNSIYVKKITAIERAESQTVKGTNYALTLRLQDTDCMKNRPFVNSDCHFLSDARMDLMCNVVIYRDLQREFSMTKFNCQDVPRANITPRNKRQAFGGASGLDVNSSEVVGLHPLISREVTQRTNSPNLMRVTKTISATKQVVAGIKYNLKVELSSTECPSGVNTNPETCHISKTPMKQICDVSIWSKPWLKFTEITSVSCVKNEDETPEESNDNSFADGELKRLATMLKARLDDQEFHQFAFFLAAHEKVYSSESEYQKRFRVFRANMKKVKYLQETEQGTGEYGATEFADLTQSEFKKHYLGLKVEEGRWPQRPQAVIPNVTLPAAYDWRDFGVVTKVKNQGICGSCWAFSITGNIEGQYAIQNKELLSLSEQELVDCDKYDSGCNGGYFDSAFHALEDLGGLETETDYPYEGYDDKCRFNSSKVKVSISGSVNISSDETQMAKWLYKNGPITVALNANAMQFYLGGVSHPLKFLCSPDNLDHGVLIVGFGVHKTMFLKRELPYWIVKNSWGPKWGKQGYYWLYRGDGSCGINKMPTSAVL